MKKLTDLQKIHYIVNVNSKDKISGYHRKVTKMYLQELYNETIQQHDQFARMHDKELITSEDCGIFQNNCIRYIKLLKQLNNKHKLLKRLLD